MRCHSRSLPVHEQPVLRLAPVLTLVVHGSQLSVPVSSWEVWNEWHAPQLVAVATPASFCPCALQPMFRVVDRARAEPLLAACLDASKTDSDCLYYGWAFCADHLVCRQGARKHVRLAAFPARKSRTPILSACLMSRYHNFCLRTPVVSACRFTLSHRRARASLRIVCSNGAALCGRCTCRLVAYRSGKGVACHLANVGPYVATLLDAGGAPQDAPVPVPARPCRQRVICNCPSHIAGLAARAHMIAAVTLFSLSGAHGFDCRFLGARSGDPRLGRVPRAFGGA